MAVGVEVEHRHALDQRDALAPVVERGERADDAHHGIGHVAVVVGDVRQALDLADHVVAEEAHHPAVQRRQLGDDRRPVRRQEVLEDGEDAAIGGHLDGQLAGDLDLAVAQQQRGDGIAADEREAAPALAVLDRLEQEAGPVADELGERGDRASRGRRAARLHTGTTVYFAARERNSSRLGRMRTFSRSRAGSLARSKTRSARRTRRRKQVRSPVWQAPLPSCCTLNSNVSASQS